MPRKTFPDISTRAYEHPADKAATSVLKQTPGLPQVLDFIGSFTSDRSLRIYFLSQFDQGKQHPAFGYPPPGSGGLQHPGCSGRARGLCHQQPLLQRNGRRL
jgi:hypothetical protein